MQREIPSQTVDEIKRELIGDIEEFRKWCAMPDLTWAPEIVRLAEELKLLASDKDIDPESVEDWIARARIYIRENRIKGCDPLVWSGQDLLWHATHQTPSG
jgi:hypothetical protein